MELDKPHYPQFLVIAPKSSHRVVTTTRRSMGKRTRKRLTKGTVQRLQPGDWASCPIAARGAGTLEARALSNAAVVYYARFTTKGKRQERIKLGSLSYRDAVRQATELSLRYQSGERNLPGELKAEQTAKEQAEATAVTRTLGALLIAYCQSLDQRGKTSARTVRGTIRLHVEKSWPKLWAKPADAIATDDLVAVVGRLTDAGKMTTARQLRAYLRAAYTAAIRSRQKPDALPALRALKIASNPAADVAPLDSSKARDRELSVDELRAYWRHLKAMSGIGGALLRFHLLTGGQRIKQLARAIRDDYDADTMTLRLLDGKGKRTEPRVHLVPLIPEALEAMNTMQGDPYVFSATAGKSGATYHVLNKRMRVVVQKMDQAGELVRGPFTPGDLRRTVETRLAAAGISQATRAHLQSHGISGVQAKHYDRYSYLKEKRAALDTLYDVATGTSADVALQKHLG